MLFRSRLAFSAIAVTLLLAAHRRRTAVPAVPLALVLMALYTAQATAVAMLHGEALTRIVLLIALGAGASVVLPWGALPQLLAAQPAPKVLMLTVSEDAIRAADYVLDPADPSTYDNRPVATFTAGFKVQIKQPSNGTVSATDAYGNLADGNLGEFLKNYDQVLIPEMNKGQLIKMIREKYLVPAIGFNKVQGLPFSAEEILGRGRPLRPAGIELDPVKGLVSQAHEPGLEPGIRIETVRTGKQVDGLANAVGFEEPFGLGEKSVDASGGPLRLSLGGPEQPHDAPPVTNGAYRGSPGSSTRSPGSKNSSPPPRPT